MKLERREIVINEYIEDVFFYIDDLEVNEEFFTEVEDELYCYELEGSSIRNIKEVNGRIEDEYLITF